MTNNRQTSKIRLWIFVCFLVVLFICVYINYTSALSSNNFKQMLTTLLFSSLTLTSNSTKKELLIHKQSLNSTLREGFITFSNNNPKYLALLINLLDSVYYFSSRPIIAYGIDVELDVDINKYPRLIKRRLNRTACGPLKADSVVNWNVDILFDVVHRWPYSLPLAPRHPVDPLNYAPYLKKFKLDLNSRTTPYIHAQFSWNYRAYPFFQQALDYMRQGKFTGANYDETGINILLWKAKANHTLCMIDPYYKYLPVYELQQKTCKQYCHTAFILIHGSKNVTKMHEIFQRLKNHTGSPFIQTPNQGMHYLNETQYTCCYPDSQPSPIHPLLCQHST